MTCKRIRIGERKKTRFAGKHPELVEPSRELTPLEQILDNYHAVKLHAYRNDIFSIHTNRYPLLCMKDMMALNPKLKEAIDKYTDSLEVIKVTTMGGKKFSHYHFNVVIKINYKQ